MINKDTKMFGSFSIKAGNQGCLRFNTAFNYYNLNAIYKSFSVEKVEDIISVTKILNFSGYAISMPFKKQILNHIECIDEMAKKIGAANTIVKQDNGNYKAYNTDVLAIIEYLQEIEKHGINIEMIAYTGNGGYAAAFREAVCYLEIPVVFQITRNNWDELNRFKNCVVFNCTPVENVKDLVHNSNHFIDCIPTTKSGHKLSMMQAKHQFKLYTGNEYPLAF